MSGTATRLRVDKANGLAQGSSFPSPVNSFGNSVVGSRVGSSLTAATRETRFSFSMAGRPKRDLVKPLTSYTFSCGCWVWLSSFTFNIPLTESECVSGHFRFRLEGSNCGLPMSLQTHSGIAVTSAPVSMQNRTG